MKTKFGQRDSELRGSTPSLFRLILSDILSLILCFVALGPILCYLTMASSIPELEIIFKQYQEIFSIYYISKICHHWEICRRLT